MTLVSPDADTIQLKAKQWITDFLSLSKNLSGHQKCSITPYMHVLVYHVPDQIRRYGSVRFFSGQGKLIMTMPV